VFREEEVAAAATTAGGDGDGSTFSSGSSSSIAAGDGNATESAGVGEGGSGSAAHSSQQTRMVQPNEVRFHQAFDSAGSRPSVRMGTLGGSGLWGVTLRVSRAAATPTDSTTPGSGGDGASSSVGSSPEGPAAATEVVEVRALVDTGAPISVLNAAAARALGLLGSPGEGGGADGAAAAGAGGQAAKSGGGLLGRMFSALQPRPPQGAVVGLAPASAPLRLEVTSLGGGDGTAEGGGDARDSAAAGGDTRVWEDLGVSGVMVGDLPGFAALGVAPGEPAAILGLDALAARDSVVFLPKQQLMLL
jgi:hypothetical protein